jgi:hypothetical protein
LRTSHVSGPLPCTGVQVNNLPDILKTIERLAAVCRAEIEASDRPLDAVPLDWVLPVFFVHLDHRANWEQSVASEVLDRIARLKQKPELLVIPESELQATSFALSHAELLRFRKGPLLRMLSLVDLRLARNKGGRTKRLIERSIREALEFEVFRRDPEIGALISCMRARFDGADRPVAKGAGLDALTQLAWVSGVPTKGNAADNSLSEEDRRLALFESLRLEGEKHAVGWLPGLTEPAQAEASIIAQVRHRAAAVRSRAYFQTAIEVAASWVRTLMKACAHVTYVAEEKHQLAKRFKKVEELRRAPKGDNPFHRDPMTLRQHALFAREEFTALELAFIAVAADVDPNLIVTNHVLATPEFRLARKIGRIGRGHGTSFDGEEIKDLKRLILADPNHAEGGIYADVDRYLIECARELLSTKEWLHRLNYAIATGQTLTLPD